MVKRTDLEPVKVHTGFVCMDNGNEPTKCDYAHAGGELISDSCAIMAVQQSG